MTMRTMSFFRRAAFTAIPPPLLLFALLSLRSPACRARAFDVRTSRPAVRRPVRGGSVGAPLAPPVDVGGARPSSSVMKSLSFLRGGQQERAAASAADGDTVASDETASLGSPSLGAQRRAYGTRDGEAPSAGGVRLDGHLDVEAGDGGPEPSSPAVAAASSPLLAAAAPGSAALRAAASFYVTQLVARPVLTKSLTAGIVFGLSDWCAQLIEGGAAAAEDDGSGGNATAGGSGGGRIEFSRVLTSSLVGLLFFGPAAHAWYAAVFKFLPSTDLFSTLQKAALGQLIFGPAFTCVFFGAGMIRARTFGPGAWLAKIRSDLPGVWASGLGFWPAVDFVSYKVVPVQWIPLFVNFCSFVWTIYLSLVSNRGEKEE
ncbi:hypothetical protein ACHAWF_004278 [Thalassiosira exigua]